MSVESITNKPSCFLIGNTSLLIKCCDLLLLKNWVISGIISSDSGVIDYANKKNISLKDKGISINSFLSQTSFDYLFSIVNEFILDKTILNLPLKLSINYHDSLLPIGAGVFSTTWALINRVQEYGITWHIIDEGIDTGDILIQKKIEIEKQESSLSLNIKCYQAAIESFIELLNGLQGETLNRKKQDITKRTYFPRDKRPSNVGVLNFSESELYLETLLSALDFGETLDNNFCSPKIFLGNKFHIPIDYSFKRSRKNTQINCIEEASTKGIDIKVGGEKTLSISSMTTIDGEKVELNTLIEDFKLGPGFMLPFPDNSYLSQLQILYERIIGKEGYWVRKLSNLNLVKFPFVNKEKSGNDESSIIKYGLNDELLRYCKQINNDGTDINLTSLILMYISRLLDNTEFDIWVKINSEYSEYPNLFSPFVPLGCQFKKYSSVAENLELNNNHIIQTIKKETFARDIYTRIKILQELDIKSVAKKVPFFIGQIDNPKEFESILQVDWGVLVSLNTSALYLIFSAGKSNTLVAEKFFHHFSVFTQSIINQTGNIYCEIPLLTKLEKDKKIFELNQQRINYPDNVCIHELIENWATKTPEEIAIVLKDKQLSYKELNQKANKIAAYLINNGTCQGDKVGVMMDRSVNIIVSFLGILKTGAAYVPLDINLPASRLKYMIDDSEIKTLIIEGSISNSFNQIKTVLFSNIINTHAVPFGSFPKFSSNNLAYIKYTSGSTGQPKGVMITHKNVAGFLYSYKQVVNVYERRIGTCVAPLSFDTSVEEVYSCLCFGGTVHIMMKEQTTDLEYFARYLVDKKINVSYIIPEFIEGIGKYLKNESTISLKTLLTGLHAKRNNVFRPFFELQTPVRVINAYGPTEVTYGSNAYQVKGNEDPLENTPIGKPFPNYNTYVVDSNMQLLPDFIPGELLIGGIGLSRGYINKPGITDLKFVDFETEKFKTQVYKSGDVVYSLPSGDIQFVGRNDDQVKISGYRIEINEIEEALNSHENVKTSIVIKRKGGKKHDQLIAYIILKTKMDNAGIQLHKFLQDKIPGYMIPAFIVPIDSLPRFSNGKTNYALLPEPDYSKKSNNTNIKKPETITEEKIKQIFEEQLDIETIGVEDNYFDLGGDSITAVHIMQQIEKVFGKKIPISMLYKYNSIRKLSNEIMKQSSESNCNSIIPIREEGDKEPIFLIHDLGGSILVYSNIIKKLDKGYPVYGIQSNYNDDIDFQNDGIEKISGEYIKNILSVSTQKCIVLIGFSFGGIIAFEMARQLNKLGYRTCLIILDTLMSGIYYKMHPKKYLMIGVCNWSGWVFPYFCKSVFTIFKTRNFKYFLSGIRRIKFEVIQNFIEIMRIARVQNPEQVNILNENININLALVQKYYPEIYYGNLFLIQCKSETEGEIVNKTKTNYFRPYVAGKILKKQVNASHANMLNYPYAEEITEVINSFLLSNSES